MGRHRYQRPNMTNPEQDALPRDTVCTVLVRQSTAAQRDNNLFSSEVKPEELRREAIERWGFVPEQVQVIDQDMGIGAYNTTIADRPGLQHWLYELLPSGRSKVLLVSLEDRLFRDKWEDQHNTFIRQVATHGGWVICGHNVYNFRIEMHCENFRLACKSGKYHIEHHIKRRLHPAAQRAAMQGRYTGGAVSWGYVVDYDLRSSTYKHLLVYPPHAQLAVEHVFRCFAGLSHPSIMELVRHWEREGLVWPFYGPEVDPRVVRAADACRTRDEARGGYLFHRLQANRMLTDVTYLGWRVRGGEVALDRAAGTPLVCHPPIVDADLFWWCYDHLEVERPAWAPERVSPVPARVRTRMSYRAAPGEVRFLAPGRVRCSLHVRPFAVTDHHDKTVLVCNNNDWQYRRTSDECVTPRATLVEQALCTAFVEQLTLDERDVAELAQLAQQRTLVHDDRRERLRKEVAEQKAILAQVVQLAAKPENAVLADELLGQARQAKAAIAAREAELAVLADTQPVTSQAWGKAQQASTIAERIRSTFGDWSRAAQAKVFALALDDALLGYVDRYTLGLWARWAGGRESRAEFVMPRGKKLRWTDEEREALKRHYGRLTWSALQRMLPSRSVSGIRTYANELGLVRDERSAMCDEPPIIVPGPVIVNTLAAHGFPLPEPVAGIHGDMPGVSLGVRAS